MHVPREMVPGNDIVVELEDGPQDFHVLDGGQVLSDNSVTGARLRTDGSDTILLANISRGGLVTFETGVIGWLVTSETFGELAARYSS